MSFFQPWPANPLLYEINTRVWLNELSARLGRTITLDKVPNDEIDRLARLGFHGVWLMGVWTTGADAIHCARTHPELQHEYRQALPDFTTQDVIGSPYAISTYTVSEKLGGPQGLAAFRGKLERHGIRLMLDFVCNHTSRDHKLVLEHPEMFVQGKEEDLARNPPAFFKTPSGAIVAHGRDPYFPAWTDTAQINYGHAGARAAMKEKLLSIAAQCDGVRCDMAMLILPEIIEKVWNGRLPGDWIRRSFWKEAIDELHAKFPHFLFLAESYWNLEWKLQEEGFNYTYDKTLYDRLRQKDLNGTRQHLQANIRFQQHCARFIENHDEPRAVAVFGPARARSAATVGFFAPGLKLLHEGQIEGRRVKIPVQLGRRPVESEDVETAVFYEKMLGVLQDPIFQNGTFNLRDVNSAGWGDSSNESLVALSWLPAPRKDAGTTNVMRRHLGYLIVVNLNSGRAYGRVPLPQNIFENNKQYVFNDRLDGKRYERAGGELISPGLYIALEATQQHLFEIFTK